MKISYFIPIVSLAVLLGACKKEDTVAPVIDAFTVNGQAEEVSAQAGSSLSFAGTLSDNENLKQFKIDVHDVFDGHSHNKVQANTPFTLATIKDIEGTTYTLSEIANIPAGAAAGPYDILLQVVDEVGNEGAFKEVELTITRLDQASITVTSHDLSVDNSVNRGARLTLAGMVMDDVDLVEVKVSLVESADGHSHKTGSGAILYSHDFDLTGSADTQWDLAEIENQGFPIDIASTAEAGHYELTLVAIDSDGNYTVVVGHFDVL